MIPFLHGPLVQDLLQRLSAAVPASEHRTAALAPLELLLRGSANRPPEHPTISFSSGAAGDDGPGDTAVARMVELLSRQVSVEIRGALSERQRRTALQQLGPALGRVKRRLGEDGNHEVLGALVRSVLVVRPPLFASHTSLLGMVVVGPQEYIDDTELSTLILHEVVHQAIFLHDLVDPLFQPATHGEDLLAYNPLLDTQRPFDMCFHAAFVSYVVARLYCEAGRANDAAALLAPLGRCVSTLAGHAHALTPRGAAHLHWLSRHLAADSWVQRAAKDAGGGGSQRPRSYGALHQ